MKWYIRRSRQVFFVWPALAFGNDLDGRPFMEFGWMFWAVGMGDAP